MRDRRQRPRRQESGQSTPTLTTALDVLLQRRSDFVSGHEMHVTLCALLRTNHATRQAISQWITEHLTRDITRRHEVLAIPVHLSTTTYLHTLLLLLQFKYTTRVRIPVPREKHALPPTERDRLAREQDDVARVVRGCRFQLYALYAKETGWGIHAAQRISTGEYVGEYTGELISSEEARRRHVHEYDRARLNYVLALREQARNTSIVRTNVDASRYGSYARFFNHSCEPTLRVEAVRVDSFVPRLVFFTKRELEQDEQLTFDYGCISTSTTTSRDVHASARDERDTGASSRELVDCHCKAATCRGFMPFDASL